MYRQINDEIDRVPWTVKSLLCLGCTSTIILTIIFCVVLVFIGDISTLITDASTTLKDTKRIMPDIENSLQILKNMCKKNPRMC